MFRLIRTAFLVLIAFVVGTMYERFNTRAACEAAPGTWSSGICMKSESAND